MKTLKYRLIFNLIVSKNMLLYISFLPSTILRWIDVCVELRCILIDSITFSLIEIQTKTFFFKVPVVTLGKISKQSFCRLWLTVKSGCQNEGNFLLFSIADFVNPEVCSSGTNFMFLKKFKPFGFWNPYPPCPPHYSSLKINCTWEIEVPPQGDDICRI